MKENGYKLVSDTIVVREGGGKTFLSILGVVIGTTAAGTWQIYRLLRAIFDEKTRRCGIFGVNSSNRQLCMLKVKMEIMKRLIDYKEVDTAVKTKAKVKYAKYAAKYDKLNKKMLKAGRVGHNPSPVGSRKWSGFDKGGVAVNATKV
jgi:hypothetical protein